MYVQSFDVLYLLWYVLYSLMNSLITWEYFFSQCSVKYFIRCKYFDCENGAIIQTIMNSMNSNFDIYLAFLQVFSFDHSLKPYVFGVTWNNITLVALILITETQSFKIKQNEIINCPNNNNNNNKNNKEIYQPKHNTKKLGLRNHMRIKSSQFDKLAQNGTKRTKPYHIQWSLIELFFYSMISAHNFVPKFIFSPAESPKYAETHHYLWLRFQIIYC